MCSLRLRLPFQDFVDVILTVVGHMNLTDMRHRWQNVIDDRATADLEERRLAVEQRVLLDEKRHQCLVISSRLSLKIGAQIVCGIGRHTVISTYADSGLRDVRFHGTYKDDAVKSFIFPTVDTHAFDLSLSGIEAVKR